MTDRDQRQQAPDGWEWPAEQVRRLGHDVVDLLADYLSGLPQRPVFRPYPAELVEALGSEPVPAMGAPVEAVLDDFRRQVAPYPFGNGHPRFHAWVNSPPHLLGVYAEALAAAMNPSVAGGNHAAVHVEHQVVRWFAELAGYGPDSAGLLVSGGSMATLTALAVARHRAGQRAGIDVRADGVQAPVDEGGAPPRRFVLYLGTESHGAARKAVELLGLGASAIRTIDSDREHRMRPDLLRARIERDRAEGHVPVAAMASAGTTNTGAIDPLDDIADVCAEQGVWLHVDAAYGGPAVLLLDRYQQSRAGLARADSLALDPHKWLYAPVDAGLVLLRDGAAARDTFSLVPPYLRTDGDPAGVGGPVWFSEYGFEQTRPFRALKIWMLLKHLGLAGYRELISHDLALAERLAATVQAAPDLELLARGLSVVCFRCRPPSPRLGPAPEQDQEPEQGRDSLDELNRRVLAAVQLGGRAFLAGTTVDGVFALRACLVNPGTGAADVDAVVAEVRAALATLAPAPAPGSLT